MLKLKVLIIDDEVDYCRILENYFKRKSYEVFLSFILKDGLAQIDQLKPDILILDNNLPDGIGILKINEFKKYCKQIIVISAMSNLNDQAIEAGADHFFMKPLSFKDFDLVVN